MFKLHKISIKDKILFCSIWSINFSHKSNKSNKMLVIANKWNQLIKNVKL